MNATQERAKEFNDVTDIFLERSYEKFDNDFTARTIFGVMKIDDEGVITVKSFLYMLWLLEKNCMDAFKYIRNHEGVWEFHVYQFANLYYSEHLKDSMKRVFSFQGVDDDGFSVRFVKE